jgi:hypothetical protein
VVAKSGFLQWGTTVSKGDDRMQKGNESGKERFS